LLLACYPCKLVRMSIEISSNSPRIDIGSRPEITLIGPGDAEELPSIFGQAYIAANVHPDPEQGKRYGATPETVSAFVDESLLVRWTPERFDLYSRSPGNALYVAKLGKKVIGFAESRIVRAEDDESPGVAELDAIEIGDGYRGRGVGKALYDAVMQRHEHLGCPVTIAIVTEWAEEARAFYHRQGAIELGTVESSKTSPTKSFRLPFDITQIGMALLGPEAPDDDQHLSRLVSLAMKYIY